MTVLTDKNTIAHTAEPGQDTFAYDFVIISEADTVVSLDGALYDRGYVVTGLGNPNGGTVILDDPISGDDAHKILVVARVVPLIQDIDYTAYDGFPAETHESGLDRAVMMAQQNREVGDRALRFPIGDLANTEFPYVTERANKFAYFDNDGNAVAYEADVSAPAVNRLDIQDGSGGPDSRSMLIMDVQSGGTNFPKIGVNNINAANGIVQINQAGKIPADLLDFTNLRPRGTVRGDDLCPKPGDAEGVCIAPDYRNPSELNPSFTFTTGDFYIITMFEGEDEGGMNLRSYAGQEDEEVTTVTEGDILIYLEDVGDTPTGWYHYARILTADSANNIIYDDADNDYVVGLNVQVALDAIDAHLVAHDDWFLTQRNQSRETIPITNFNAVNATGIYGAPTGTPNAPTPTGEYMLWHAVNASAIATQIAINAEGGLYGRAFSGTWGPWLRVASGAVQDEQGIQISNNSLAISVLSTNKIEADDYAAPTVGGTLKARLAGSTLYLTNNGTNP